MLPVIKIIAIAAIAVAVLAYLKKTATSIKTFQWLLKVIVSAAVALILGIIIGIF